MFEIFPYTKFPIFRRAYPHTRGSALFADFPKRRNLPIYTSRIECEFPRSYFESFISGGILGSRRIGNLIPFRIFEVCLSVRAQVAERPNRNMRGPGVRLSASDLGKIRPGLKIARVGNSFVENTVNFESQRSKPVFSSHPTSAWLLKPLLHHSCFPLARAPKPICTTRDGI